MRMPERVRRALSLLAAGIIESRAPDFVVGDEPTPYLRRWYVLPRNPIFNVYVHEFLRSDSDVALHDHMYVNLSLVLTGGYVEEFRSSFAHRPPGSVVARLPTTPHRVILLPVGVANKHPVRAALDAVADRRKLRPATSIFVCGPRVRNWGFHCPSGWKPWQEVVEVTDNVSRHGGRKC